MRQKPANEQVEFLRGIVFDNVRSIVEFEDEVRVQWRTTPDPPEPAQRLILTVFVMPSDMGLVLGDKGATADAIRRIVWTACKKTTLKCDIDFQTNGRSR